LTWDQGREMANWVQLQADADIDVFFCDPHSPWQRPSNEHMNGLLRQYFPKGTDLNNVSLEEVRHVAAEMNGRPRKVLGWRTPAEVYADVIATAA
ncbi:MAG: IS30 family transposase, partial [Ilumatobacteraceae bacterium]